MFDGSNNCPAYLRRMFPVPAAPLLHLLLETLGVIVAMAYYRHLRRAAPDPISDDRRFHLLIAAAAGAFIGSRLIGALEQPAYFLSGGGPAGLLYYFQSKTIVGGLLGGLFAVEATKRFVGIHHRSGDLYVYPLIVAMIIGRVGCFLMGVGEPTFGIPTTAITGLDLGDGMLRHPTALYEIALLLTFLWRGRGCNATGSFAPGAYSCSSSRPTYCTGIP